MGSAGPPQLKKPWIETPLLESPILSRAAGCRIFLKLENLQPSGSFKSRGIGNLALQSVLRHQESGEASFKQLHFYSSSGGNAGLACVTAACSLGYPATVVVPMSTKPMMIDKIQIAGATAVIQHGASWMEADQHLREVVIPQAEAKGEHGIYVHPFEHQDIWQGCATMISEIQQQLNHNKPDAIICSVGGGGLFSGIITGLDQTGWSDAVRVVTVETHGAESLHQSIQAGELITLPAITSIATSLGARRVSPTALSYTQTHDVTSTVLDDAEACTACWRFLDDERMMVEPACGASVAMCYDGRLKQLIPNLTAKSKVVVIVCGGSAVTLDLLNQWREEFGNESAKKTASQETRLPSEFTIPRSADV